jgi:hypothetical protein
MNCINYLKKVEVQTKNIFRIAKICLIFKKNGKSLQEQYKAKYSKLLNYSVKLSDHHH